MERKVILFISMSLDGYIADKYENLDFLSIVAHEGQDYGYNNFLKNIDAIIIGRKTYDKVNTMGFDYPHQDKDVFIISRSERPAIGNFQFYNGDLYTLVTELKSKQGKNIYCDGGAEIVFELMKNNLIDEYIISVIPIFLGDGIKLFKDGRTEQRLELISSTAFETGLLQMHYQTIKNPV